MISYINCSTDDELARMVAGKLPTSQVDSICIHVESCTRCQALLAQLEVEPDGFIRSLTSITEAALAKARIEMELESKLESTRLLDNLSRLTELKSNRPTLHPPCQLGPYEVQKLIAKGGMGDEELADCFLVRVGWTSNQAGSLNRIWTPIPFLCEL